MHRRREVADSTATMLDVTTAEAEVFPVKRKLLRPCISLTQAVRDTAQVSVQLDSVGTLVFDRCLPCRRPYPAYHFLHALCLKTHMASVTGLDDASL